MEGKGTEEENLGFKKRLHSSKILMMGEGICWRLPLFLLQSLFWMGFRSNSILRTIWLVAPSPLWIPLTIAGSKSSRLELLARWEKREKGKKIRAGSSIRNSF